MSGSTLVLVAVAAGIAVLALARKPAGGVPSIPVPPLGPLPAPPSPAMSASGPHPLTLAAILAAGAMVAAAVAYRPTSPPRPDMPPPSPNGWPTLDLRGAFIGETAAEDATTTGYLLSALADCIAHDGARKEPRLKSALAFDDLRRAARDYRMGGGTLGDRQPIARDRIKAFLDAAVGDYGGPVDEARRTKYVQAFGDVSKAALAAVGR
jgi:hypothetical protein